MLTVTAIKSPVFLMNIKSAALLAARLCGMGNGDIGISLARNRNGRPSVSVVFRRGFGLEFFDMEDNDITARVVFAMHMHHAEQRKARQVIAVDHWLSTDDLREFYPYGRPDNSARLANQL